MTGPRARVVVAAVATLGAVGLAVATILAAGADLTWSLALLEHFRLHYLALALVITVAAVAIRAVAVADAGALVALVNLIAVLEPTRGAPPRAAGPPHRLVSINVHTSNRDHAAVARFIARTRPDVLVLLEVDRTWVAALATATAEYAVRIEEPRDDNFGIALYARAAATPPRVVSLEGFPTIDATVTVAARPWRVLATHPMPPVGAASAELQARQLAAVAALVRAGPGPTIVIGDLNVTPWSRGFRRLVAASGLRDSRLGFGVQATFPAGLGWIGIPIDHALVSPDLAVVDRWVGPDVGSDHRPLVLDVADAR